MGSMNIKSLFQSLKKRLGPQQEIQDEVVLRFLKVLENVRHDEMSCQEMYAQLDEFVEREVKTHDASKLMPLIQEHIDMCPECCDEYEALLTVLENTKEHP
jgi:hypothetical protein